MLNFIVFALLAIVTSVLLTRANGGSEVQRKTSSREPLLNGQQLTGQLQTLLNKLRSSQSSCCPCYACCSCDSSGERDAPLLIDATAARNYRFVLTALCAIPSLSIPFSLFAVLSKMPTLTFDATLDPLLDEDIEDTDPITLRPRVVARKPPLFRRKLLKSIGMLVIQLEEPLFGFRSHSGRPSLPNMRSALSKPPNNVTLALTARNATDQALWH